MKILITNDDGINAEGLKVLLELTKKYGEVLVVAPEIEQSGKSHGINVYSGIEVKKYDNLFPGVIAYGVNSTPADCVRFAHYHLKYDFDVVFSGVNNGYNMGEDIMYSGTVAGASEAVFCGKKGIAFSTIRHDFSGVKKYFDSALDYILHHDLLSKGSLYNVNFPPIANDIIITKQGSTHYDTRFDFENDLYFQRGKPYFNLESNNVNTDVYAIINNNISITPLTVDRTSFDVLDKLINHK